MARRDKAKAALDSFVDEKSKIYVEIEKLNEHKQEIMREVGEIILLESLSFLFHFLFHFLFLFLSFTMD